MDYYYLKFAIPCILNAPVLETQSWTKSVSADGKWVVAFTDRSSFDQSLYNIRASPADQPGGCTSTARNVHYSMRTPPWCTCTYERRHLRYYASSKANVWSIRPQRSSGALKLLKDCEATKTLDVRYEWDYSGVRIQEWYFGVCHTGANCRQDPDHWSLLPSYQAETAT